MSEDEKTIDGIAKRIDGFMAHEFPRWQEEIRDAIRHNTAATGRVDERLDRHIKDDGASVAELVVMWQQARGAVVFVKALVWIAAVVGGAWAWVSGHFHIGVK